MMVARRLLSLFLLALGACGANETSALQAIQSDAGSGATANDAAPPSISTDADGSTTDPPRDGADAASDGKGGGASARDGSAGGTSGGQADASGGGGGTDASSKSSKRGLAYGYNSTADLNALSSGISWWYNWSASPDSTLTGGYASTGVEFVPMIWGGTFDVNTLDTQVPAGAKYLLTFNEPNFGTQSNLTPAQAAALWPQVETFANAHGLKIVSPALNYCGGNCNETNPFTWLDDFFAACTNCQVDYIAAHWYACSTSALTGYLGEYEAKYTQPLWLTEFSCLDGSLPATDGNEQTYMNEALAVLEADPRVFRYSWFTGRSTATPPISILGDAGGTLTPLGAGYLAAP